MRFQPQAPNLRDPLRRWRWAWRFQSRTSKHQLSRTSRAITTPLHSARHSQVDKLLSTTSPTHPDRRYHAMPLIRPSQARNLRCLRKTPITSLPRQQRNNLSATARRAGGDSHGSHYDPPSGWLWGIAPGQKYEKEGWETIFYWMFCGGCVAGAVGYAFKPDTR